MPVNMQTGAKEFIFFFFCGNIVKEFLKSRDFTQRRDYNRYNFKLYKKTIGKISGF